MSLAWTSTRLILGIAAGSLLAGCGPGVGSEDPKSDPGVTPAAELASETVGLPHVTVVREVTPEEFDDLYEMCMAEAGWVLSMDEFGQRSIDLAPGQEADYDVASHTCSEQYPVAEKYSDPLNDQQWRLVYDHYAAGVIPCLQSLGYSPDPLPSFERFLATANSTDAYEIISSETYAAITNDVVEGRWETPDDVIQQECHVQPPSDVLYPE